MEKFGILLLGNCSSLPYNKQLVEETANMIRRKHKVTVYTAFLNKDTPSIREVLNDLSTAGIDPVVGDLAYQRAREALEENKNETI